MGQAVPVMRVGWCESCGGCVEEGVGQRLGVGGAVCWEGAVFGVRRLGWASGGLFWKTVPVALIIPALQLPLPQGSLLSCPHLLTASV